MTAGRVCEIPDCTATGIYARGWCMKHYTRWLRHGDPLFLGSAPEVRFWKRVNRGDADSCWEWQGQRDEDGYGIFTVDHRRVRAHRYAWLLTHGEISAELLACHRCDNPPCVNPAHLFLGTMGDNSRDSWAKGRAWLQNHGHEMQRPRGSAVVGSKLTEAKVREIRSLMAAGRSASSLAREYGVAHQSILRAANGQNWKHVV